MKIISLASIFFLIVISEAIPIEHEVEQLEPVPEAAFNAEADVRFLLFSRLNPIVGQQLLFRNLNSLRNSNYNGNLPTRVIIHGFQNDASSDVNILLTAAFLRNADVNVIVVDWSAGAGTLNYISARNRVFEVGPLLAQYLDFLHENSALDFSRLLVTGHSLGAHISGIAGKNVRRGRIATIIGMDPAGPLFDINNPSARLDWRDAEYVESIHTDTTFGIGATISHVDFFPNNGNNQPGCITSTCGHGRAVSFHVEAINSNLLRGNRCQGVGELNQNIRCTGESAVIGNPANARNNLRGIYQVFTNSRSPFGRG